MRKHGEEHKTRVKKIRAGMEKRGLDALYICNASDTRYVSNYRLNGVVLLPAESDPILLVRNGKHPGTATMVYPLWTEECKIELKQSTNFTKDTKKFFKDVGVADGSIGITDNNIPYRVYTQLQKELPDAKLEFASDLVAEIRLIKSEWELNLYRRACEIADASYETLCEVAKPGVKEYEVTAACEHTCKALGAESYFGQWSMGPSTYITFRGDWPIDRKLKKGDMIVCETNPRYEGYSGHFGRTVVLGKPTAEKEKLLNVLLEAQEEGIKMVVPGSKCLDVEKFMYDFIVNEGYDRKYITHQLSHDVDVPFPKERVIFKPGMTWSIHPGAFIPGVGGGFINDLVLITSNGSELFFKSPRELVQI